MIGDSVLRVVIGANALGTVARTDHAFAGGGAFGVEFLALHVVEPAL